MISPELRTRMQDMLDGELSAEELAALEAELLENAEARAAFRRLAWLHSDLEVMYAGRKAASAPGIVPLDRLMTRQRKRIVRAAFGAAAAAVLIMAAVLAVKSVPAAPLAGFRTTADADFTIIHDGAPAGITSMQELKVGSGLELRTGRVEAKFRSGVRVVIDAPCGLRVLAKDRVAISHGSAWFEVPPAAKGFTVETAAFTVVDLGTAFGIDATVTGRPEVHVGRGAVEVTSRVESVKTMTLKEGEALQADGQGQLRAIEFDAHRFAATLPYAEGLVGHWEFEGVPNGLVADSSGYGHLGRLEGGAKTVTDPERGQVLRLDGAGARRGWVDLDSVKPIPNLLAHRGVTLAIWVRRDNYTAGKGGDFVGALALGRDGHTPIASIGVNNAGAITCYIEGDGGADQVHVKSADGVVPDEVWTHLAVTFDRANNVARMYRNGVQTGGDVDISIVGDGELDWAAAQVGTLAPGGHVNWDFRGRLDDARVYDRPLRPEEIAELAR